MTTLPPHTRVGAMTLRITPSILNADLANLSGEIARIPTADGLHLAVMDGSFVPNLTACLPIVEAVSRVPRLPI